jgi:type II secretory pathway component PulF
MPQYKYNILTEEGVAVSEIGELPAASLWEAHEYLESKGNIVISVEPLPAYLVPLFGLRKFLDRRKIKRIQIAEFLRNLAVMLNAGVPVIEALGELSSQPDNVYMGSVAASMKSALESGVTFSEAINRHNDLFPQSVCYLAKVGEQVGLLGKTLMDASEHLTKIDRILVGINKALMYPLFVFVFAFGACVFWLYYTVPNMLDLFKQMQVEIPALTQWVLDASEAMQESGASYLIGLFVLIFLLRLAYSKIPKFRVRLYKMAMGVPAIGRLIESSNMSFIFEYFALLFKSGVDVHTSLGIIGDAIENPVYAQKMREIKVAVESGIRLSDAFSASGIFPSMVVKMFAIGEASGKLDDQMEFISEDYATKLADDVDTFKAFIEPLAIGIVGGFMIFMIVALFLPVYDLIGGATSM